MEDERPYQPAPPTTTSDLYRNEGAIGAFTRAHDWRSSPLGPPETWPPSLGMAVRLILSMRQPASVFWGPRSLVFYNDAFRALAGDEIRPGMLSRPAAEMCPLLWTVLGPQVAHVMSGQEATWTEDQPVPTHRDGQRATVWWTYGCSPIEDDATASGVGGVLVTGIDVTREHQLREGLPERQAQLDTFVTQAPAAVAMLDRSMRYIAASRRYLSDYHLTEQDLVGRPHLDVIPTVPSHWPAIVARALSGHHERAEADAYVRPDGRREWVRWELLPWIDIEGAIGGVLLFSEFVTEQAEARHRLEALSQTIPGLVFVTDARGKNTFVNQRFAKFVGRSPESLMDDGWLETVHPEDAGRAAIAWNTAVRNGTSYEVEYRFRRADGAWRWFLVRGEPTRNRDGAIEQWFGVCTDIDGQKTAEAALALSEERLRLAREAAGFGVWDWDLSSGLITWLPEQWALHGVEPYEGGPKYIDWVSAIHPEDIQPAQSLVMAALADPAIRYDTEYRVRSHDGSYRWLMAKGQVVREAGGTAIRMIGVNMDVTARREAEQQLRELTRTLSERVDSEVHAREIAQVRAAQAERMQALGQLAGGIAHDLNNVLQAVQGGTLLIERRAAKSEDIARLARMVLDATERGASVTRRLLAFARRGDLRAQPIAVPALMRELLEILAPALGAAIRIEVAVRSDLPLLLADKGQLETVLVNLATNARDAMPQGGTLTFAADVVDVESANSWGLQPGRYVLLMISDTGCGMSPEVAARALDPFFTTKPVGQGTGLGLPMAKGFAEQSGGALRIDSAADMGTTVSIWLPVNLEVDGLGPKENATVTNDSTAIGAGYRVLLVDDEQLVRDTLVEQLQDAGYAVEQAATPAEGLRIIDSGLPLDALVADLSMPGGMDGLDLIRAARARRPRIPSVLLTGYASDSAASSLALGQSVDGAFALIRKPISGPDLADRIAALLVTRDLPTSASASDEAAGV